jgi:tetrahydromethanopterin S-methyltransferase subunit G
MYLFWKHKEVCLYQWYLLGIELGNKLGSELGMLLGFPLGTALGTELGSKLGKRLGTELGLRLGSALGAELAVLLGVSLGLVLGAALGSKLGSPLGVALGIALGKELGKELGTLLNIFDGSAEGFDDMEGTEDGTTLGFELGLWEGLLESDGCPLGSRLGLDEGSMLDVGSRVLSSPLQFTVTTSLLMISFRSSKLLTLIPWFVEQPTPGASGSPAHLASAFKALRAFASSRTDTGIILISRLAALFAAISAAAWAVCSPSHLFFLLPCPVGSPSPSKQLVGIPSEIKTIIGFGWPSSSFWHLTIAASVLVPPPLYL